MSSENIQENSSSNPIGTPANAAQQDWLEVGQQGVAGETLKAKKWVTQRRLVDDTSHHGNIHTGTEQQGNLDKSDTLTGDSTDYRSLSDTNRERQENTSTGQQPSTVQRAPFEREDVQKSAESTSADSGAYKSRTDAESVVTSSRSETLPFEGRFDDSASIQRPATGSRSTANVAQPPAAEGSPEPIPEEIIRPIAETSLRENTSPTVDPVKLSEAVAEEPDSTPTSSPSPTVPTPDANPELELEPEPQPEPEPEPEPEVFIEDTASPPTLTTADTNGIEDTDIAIDVSSQLTDTDGSESLSITISGVPPEAFLSAGINLGDGNWELTPNQLEGLRLTPPANSDNNFSLTITATSTESHGGQQSSVSEIIDVFIEGSADAPVLNTQATQGDEDTAIALDITPLLADTDGSESLSEITIAGLPEGAILSAGTENNDGSWSLSPQDLIALTVTPAPDNNNDFELSLSVTSTDTNGSTATTHAVLPVTIKATADEASITGVGGTVTEDTVTSLSGQLSIIDPDANEDHFNAESVQGTYGVLELSEAGSWTYTLDNEAENVQQLREGQVTEDIITITSADGTEHQLSFGVNGTNDVPTLDVVSTATVEEDGTKTISFTAADTDGTVATTATAGHGTVTVDQDNGNITYTPDPDYNGTDSITVTSTDNDNATAVKTVDVTVSDVNDTPIATNDTTTTDEDSSVLIDVLSNDTDIDSDTLTISSVTNPTDTKGNVTGTVEIVTEAGKQQVRFTPNDTLEALNDGESSSVTFSYTISDGQGGTDIATTSLTVQGTNNDLTYVSETAGYRNVVGTYQTDDDGNPISGTVVIDDQNGMAGETHLADLEPGNHDFFIISNGANEINDDSAINFDNSGDQPVLLIDGKPASHPVYYTEPGFNPDGKDHFQFESDGEGGTYINIEDLPDLGDADFGDVVLHTNFEMDDRTAVGALSDSDQSGNSVAENAAAETGIGITATAVDADGDAVSYSLSDDAGGRFTIDSETGKVTVAEGADLDFESSTSHTISVQATSSDGTDATENFTVSIQDIKENVAPVGVDDTTHPVEVTTTTTIFSTSFESVQSDSFHNNADGWSSDSKIEIRDEDIDGGVTPDGEQFIELNDDLIDYYDDAPNIWRDVNTDDNGEYSLSFQYSARPGYDDSVCRFEVVLDGEVLGTFSADGSNLSEPSWQSGTLDFSGSGDMTRVEFREAGVDTAYGRGAFIDAISLEETITTTSDQAISIDEDSTLNIDVLANDSDPDGDSLTITAVGDPVDADGNVVGTAEVIIENSKQQVRFTPGDKLDTLDADDSSSVTFSYTIDDGHGGTDTATTTIHIIGTDNDASSPTLTLNIGDGVQGTTQDEDGKAATVLAPDSPDMSGATDLGEGTRNWEDYKGTQGDDTIAAGDNWDKVNTRDGDDNVTVGDGSSNIKLGKGDDVLQAGDAQSGWAQIKAEDGNDNVTAGDGFDKITMGKGDDNLSAGDGVRDLNLGDGNDNATVGSAKSGWWAGIDAGKSDDTVVAGDDYSSVKLGDGDDTLNIGDSTSGWTQIDAGKGDDTMTIGKNWTKVKGGDGNDTVIFKGDESNFTVENKWGMKLVTNDETGEETWLDDIENVQFGGSDIEAEAGEILETYEYPVTVTATLTDTDTSESLSDVTVAIPEDITKVKDSDGNELSITDGTVNIPVTSGAAATITLVSPSELNAEQLGDIQAKATATESNGGDTSTVIIGGTGDDTIQGGTGSDTAIFSGSEADYNVVKNTDGSYTVQDKTDSRDDNDTVTDVEQFQFADKTVAAEDLTLSARLIDGAVEGVEYTTTSGLHGFTEEDGNFSFREGDDITFTVGGVTLGTATAEDVDTGQTFLQDVADVTRTDLNDEYVENMATFLQSIDENSNAYDGIVVTDEIREALAEADIDLRTASEEDVQQLVEQIGKSYVEEDDAMDHVEDMLVEHTDLDHDEFQEHIDDDLTDAEQSIRTEQKKESQLTSVAATGFDAAETDSAMEEVQIDGISDLSLDLPSLTLPGEEQEEVQAAITEEAPAVKQDAPLKAEIVAPETSNENNQQSSMESLADNDLANSLPSVSLSNLFDNSADEDEGDTSKSFEHDSKESSRPKAQTGPPAIDTDIATEKTVVAPGKPSSTDAPATKQADTSLEEETDSSDQVTESVADANAQETSELQEENLSINTDDLHISLDGEDAAKDADTTEEEDEDSSLDRFSADASAEEKENSSLDEFSANGDSESHEEMAALEELDAAATDEPDKIDDAGLNDADAIQEDLSQEPEQVDANGVG